MRLRARCRSNARNASNDQRRSVQFNSGMRVCVYLPLVGSANCLATLPRLLSLLPGGMLLLLFPLMSGPSTRGDVSTSQPSRTAPIRCRKSGFGLLHRQKSIRNAITRHVSEAAGLATQRRAPSRLPDTAIDLLTFWCIRCVPLPPPLIPLTGVPQTISQRPLPLHPIIQ